jgi:hypothetical protein
MISTLPWREQLGDGAVTIVVDTTGAPYAVDELPGDIAAPALLVGRVSEAVKEVEEDRVVGYLNRDALWAVEGFVLSNEVVSILPEEVESATTLIELVTGAGFAWSAVLPTAQSGT